MTKQTVTNRQKDLSRLFREKQQIRKDLAQTTKASLTPRHRQRTPPQGQHSKTTPLFTEADRRQMAREGLTVRQIRHQIERFKRGVPYVELNRPCRAGDGIQVIPEKKQKPLIALHDEAAANGRLIKFVPASGAASRMFTDWYRLLEDGRMGKGAEAAQAVACLPQYAFFADLKHVLERRGLDLDRLCAEERYGDILSFVLTPQGLHYGQMPKALLKFHDYPSGGRTAIEEHLVESALYVRDARKVSRLHVTVSEEHRTQIREHLTRVKDVYERRYDAIFELTVSIQESSTKTVAVDMEDRPFRLEDGRLYFRPGGHGALLSNLNAIAGDIIFLKNIDNIVPDRLKDATVLYKKILCGYLISLQQEIFRYLQRMDEGRLSVREWERILAFCREKLHIVLPESFASWTKEQRQQIISEKLNRPLRVCGMVKNEGEPGGGPFWVNEGGNAQSLQIIESMQVDPTSETQKAVWRTATHFNPVDLVCGVRNYRGEKFDLRLFVDPQTAAITKKSEKGRELKALEHPGLWNGSMANWNTVFVEVPIETFNPVKTIADLLRPTHQPSRP